LTFFQEHHSIFNKIMKNNKKSAKLFFIVFVLCFSCVGFVSGNEKGKSLIELKRENGKIILITKFHLIPPGSTKVKENIPYKKLGQLNLKTKKDLVKYAKISIDFFEKKLKERILKGEQVELKEAYFDIYRDFMGKYFIDMVYAVYELKK